MAKTDYKSIDEYEQTFSGDTLKRLQAIREMARKIAPEAEEVISYQIPAFKIGKKFLIYYCGFPKHISLSSPWSNAFLKEFETDIKDLKVSKSVIQFPLDQPLPTALIKRMLKFRKTESKIQ